MTRFSFDALPGSVHNEGQFRRFLELLDARLHVIDQAKTQLEWAKKMESSHDNTIQADINLAMDQVYTQQNAELIRTWKTKASDPYIKRWAEVMDWGFTMAQIEERPELRQIVQHISDRYVHWRPKLDGQEIPYTKQTLIFRFEPNRSIREKAWMAQWELDQELQGRTREMFSLRNEAARALGFGNYADLKLARDGVDQPWLIGLLDQMEQVTGPTYKEYMESQATAAGLSEVQPWDVQYLFDRDPWPPNDYFPGDRMKQNQNDCAIALGLDPDTMGISIHFYDSPYGGQCNYYAPGDIRILTNYGNGMLYYHTCYHEYGHALHGQFYDQPHTLRKESGMFTEGMAQFMALFLHYPSWLRKNGLPENEIDKYKRTRKLPWMYRHRRIAADVRAELAVWADPDCDMSKAYGETTSRYLMTAPQLRAFAAVPRWTMPVQMHSYFIADLISTQTHAFLRSEFAPVFGRPDALQHVRKHYWAPGNSIPWLEKVKRCTGKPLSYESLAREMTGVMVES